LPKGTRAPVSAIFQDGRQIICTLIEISQWSKPQRALDLYCRELKDLQYQPFSKMATKFTLK